MSAYEALAGSYDALTQDVPYEAILDYVEALLAHHGRQPETVLDLACGTGSLAALLAQKGYRVLVADASEEMLAIGIPALRIISVSFLFAGYAIVCSSMFQALGHGLLSLWVSLLRQLCVLLPVAYVFARFFGLESVWLSFPISEIASLVFSTIFLRHVYKKEILPMKQELENAPAAEK